MKKIIENYTNYEKDTTNGAIINRDTATYNAFKLRKQIRKQKNNEIENLKTQVNNLTTMVEKILFKLDK